jgi:hypothetical protein
MYRRELAILLLAAAAAAHAQTVDLVAHNSFEDCWSKALAKADFLTLLQTSIEGQVSCVAQSSGSISTAFGNVNYTACYTAACPGATIGCPVTVHSGTFGGDFSSGAFSAPGTADDVSVPVSYSGALTGTCTVTVSAITLTYSPYFYIVPDGNNGDYMAYLTASSAVTVNSDSFSGSDLFCSLAASDTSVTSQINTQAQMVATNAMIADLTATAVDQSVCPLTP